MAVAEPESSFEMIAAGTKQDVRVVSTGSYTDFKPVVLGTITLDKAGEQALQFKPINGKWQPINVRSVQLKPVSE